MRMHLRLWGRGDVVADRDVVIALGNVVDADVVARLGHRRMLLDLAHIGFVRPEPQIACPDTRMDRNGARASCMHGNVARTRGDVEVYRTVYLERSVKRTLGGCE